MPTQKPLPARRHKCHEMLVEHAAKLPHRDWLISETLGSTTLYNYIRDTQLLRFLT